MWKRASSYPCGPCVENLKPMRKYKSWFSPGDDIGGIKIENRNSSILADMAFEHGLKKAIEIIAKMNGIKAGSLTGGSIRKRLKRRLKEFTNESF